MVAKLTPKQAAFVREYLVDLSATAAAKRAGYSERTARSIGQRLLTNVDIQAALRDALTKRSKRTEITADRVLQELARIGFADIRDLFQWDEERAVYVPSRALTDEQAAAVSEVQAETTHTTLPDGVKDTTIKLKLKTYDKLSALEKIAKHLGMFVERHEHSGGIDVRVVYDDDDGEDAS